MLKESLVDDFVAWLIDHQVDYAYVNDYERVVIDARDLKTTINEYFSVRYGNPEV